MLACNSTPPATSSRSLPLTLHTALKGHVGHAGQRKVFEATRVEPASIADISGDALNIMLLHLDTKTSTRTHLLLYQVCSGFCRGSVSPVKLVRKLDKQADSGCSSMKHRPDPTWVVGPQTKATLVSQGALSPSNRKAPLCASVPAICKALSSAGCEQWDVQRLFAISSDSDSAGVRVGSDFWEDASKAIPLPFDRVPYPRQGPTVEGRFPGLTTAAPAAAAHGLLLHQLHSLRYFYTEPVVEGRGSHFLAMETMDTLLKHLNMYLGYCHVHLGICQPNLSHCVNQAHVGLFLRSRQQAGMSGGTIVQDMEALRKVCKWWKVQDAGLPHVHELEQVRLWLQGFKPQLRRTGPPREIQPLAVHAADLLYLIVSHKDKVVQACGGRVHSDQARQLHDACLACLSFGYLPPVRAKALRTLRMPGQPEKCDECGCEKCEGNCLHELRNGKLRLVVSHHKTLRSHGVFRQTLPDELAEIVRLYMERGRRFLLKSGVHSRVFMNMKGKQIADSASFNMYYTGMIKRFGGPHIGPNMLRHIFVTERRSEQACPGVSEADACHVMTTSPREWGRTYDRNGHAQLANAVGDLTEWRVHTLAARKAGRIPRPPPRIE